MSEKRATARTAGQDLTGNTLGELRAFLADVETMPAEARWYVRLGFGGGSTHGSRPRSITVIDDGQAGRS